MVASYAAFFGSMVPSINRLERTIDTKFDSLMRKLEATVDGGDARLSTRIDALGVKVDGLSVIVARLEGAVWGRIPSEAQQGRS